MQKEEIQRSAIESLRIFRAFCERHHLKYYLTFGSLLGAVRHKGFIPWDDDIDVFMPREDYRFLLQHFNREKPQRREVIAREICPEFYLNFAKIIDRHTAVVESGQTLQIGVWIDVFPLDKLPANLLQRRIFLTKIRLIQRAISYSYIRFRPDRVWWKKLMIKIYHALSPSRSWLEREYNRQLQSLTHYAAGDAYALLYRCFGRYIPILPVSMFEPSVTVEFEGEFYQAPREYDDFLKACYGDYMTIPPAEKQKSHHYMKCS